MHDGDHDILDGQEAHGHHDMTRIPNTIMTMMSKRDSTS